MVKSHGRNTITLNVYFNLQTFFLKCLVEHVVDMFGACFGHALDMCYTLFGDVLGNAGTCVGPVLDMLWTSFERVWNMFGASVGAFLQNVGTRLILF